MPSKQSELGVPDYILKHVSEHSKDIVTFTAEHFGITRQAVLRHVRMLLATEKLECNGTTRNRVYVLKSQCWTKEYPLDGNLSEDVVFRKDILPRLITLPDNVRKIWNYGFSEMLNNAIDHSEGSSVTVEVEQNAVWDKVSIHDNGVGIFKKIQRAFDLEDENHALLELTKGKLTTDAKRHSGEGIFFTSRVFDRFAIYSGTIVYFHYADFEGDYLFGKDYIDSNHPGTNIILRQNRNSAQTLKEVFDKFTSEHEGGFGFDKTIIPIRLAFQGDALVSRSQAKRLLSRFDRFKIAILDFEGVEEIGQAFADEIFRVFPNFHSGTKIHTIHTNEQIEKMISRAKNAEG